MQKKHALFVAFSITIFISGNYLFFQDFSPNRETVIIARVLDGDTVELEDGRKVRLLNINAPEKNDFRYSEAEFFMKKYENASVEIEISGVDLYGRTLGRLFTAGKYLNLEIVNQGLAHAYIIEEGEISEFKNAERRARETEKGIWEKSGFYGCLNVEINKKEEYLIITDICDLNFEKFTIKDESTRIYRFNKKFESEKFFFYSEKGEDNATAIFWGRGKAWNDDKDSIFIRDDKGLLVYYDSYGY